MTNPMMACGCVAQGKLTAKGGIKIDPPIPCCVVHDCTEIESNVPDLTGRISQCGCKKTEPSSFDLPFFEYRGPGSAESRDICKCGYHKVAHDKTDFRCNRTGGFVPRGPNQYDTHYCGHSGWD